MNIINFDFENCFGIAKFNGSIEFGNNNAAMIYAPNGTMKTSFAKTLHVLSQQTEKVDDKKGKHKKSVENICDRLQKQLPVKTKVTLEDGSTIKPENIFVANPDDITFDATESVTTFLASTALKERYDNTIKVINSAKNNFIKQYKKVSRSTDCETELVSTFSNIDNPNIYDIIDILKQELDRSAHPMYPIQFNDIFDKKGIVRDFIEKNMEQLELFVDRYNELLEKSQFFHVSKDGTTFGTYQAKILCNGLKDDSFFKVEHKLQLQDNTSINSYSELNNKISEEIQQIENDENLQVVFTSILEKLDGNAELRAFKDCIKNNMNILGELKDYDNLKKKVLLGYFSDVDTNRLFEELYELYYSNKNELMEIIKEAQTEKPRWKNIVDLFNARFHVPFEVKIDNQEDIILRQQAPKLTFLYHNHTGESIKQSKDEIITILSKGELRAFFILQMLFEIEARKDRKDKSLIVLDDISDSFDYQNKFAIIEYINDISNNNDKFKIILLTHNFDFYRNATQRLRINKTYMATKEVDGKIILHQGLYIMNTPLKHEIRNTNRREFISMIPFTRNIVEYIEGTNFDNGFGKENNDYMTLTNCLHLKDKTMNLTDRDIDNIICRHIKNPNYKYTVSGDKIINIIYDEAQQIANNVRQEELQIENKVVLSIAIRLKSEIYMKNKLLENGETEESLKCGKDQTLKWIDIMRKKYPNDDNIKVLERVNMMTPECIHINSFMFEPLIDMSIRHLVELYKEVETTLK